MNDKNKATVRWDENGQPISSDFEDLYFSDDNGIEESRYVFIKQNQLEDRFEHLDENTRFTIAETGFGTGLNFLCTWQLWSKTAGPSNHLDFLSVEKFPLEKSDLLKALSLWPELKPLTQCLLEQYPPVDARGFHRIHFSNNVCLTLIFEDAITGLGQLLPIESPSNMITNLRASWSAVSTFSGFIDAWFLDGFAPSKNPDMWSSELFLLMAKLSKATVTTLATFTAAGMVKRGLVDAGYSVQKSPGFGRKREMLTGFYSPLPPQLHKPNQNAVTSPKVENSWHLAKPHQNNSAVNNIVVIGGGLAGCQTALNAALKGFHVTLFEQSSLASGASGNPTGILYSKLSPTDGAFSDFNISAYLYAERFYHRRGLFEQVGKTCGVIQLANSDSSYQKLQTIYKRFQNSPSFVLLLNAREASELAGVQLDYGGLYFPNSGWLNPPNLCRALVAHKNIDIVEATLVSRLEFSEQRGEWLLLGENEAMLAKAQTVVIACANSAKRFNQCNSLPTQAIRGQISLLPPTTESINLRTVLCGDGYITPEANGLHCVGASFNLRSTKIDLDATDHESNVAHAHAMSKDLTSLKAPELYEGRVSFRCATPDYLPIIGAAPKSETFFDDFSAFRRNAKQLVDKPGQYWPGLYINIGHGSKGLCYTPICAELLMSMISNTPLPLSRKLAISLNPARFMIRDLMRNKI